MLPLLCLMTTSACSTRSGQGHPAGLYPYAVDCPHPPARTRRLEAWVARHRAATTRRAVPRLSVALPAAAPGSDRGRYRACVPGPGARAGLVASGSVSPTRVRRHLGRPEPELRCRHRRRRRRRHRHLRRRLYSLVGDHYCAPPWGRDQSQLNPSAQLPPYRRALSPLLPPLLPPAPACRRLPRRRRYSLIGDHYCAPP